MNQNENLGIKPNLFLFSLLVLTNVFVGSMVGGERTVLPLLGEKEFGLASASAALSFIVSFGFSKALMNVAAGAMADRIGRKNVLLLGWGIGLFVPVLVIFAPSWSVIVLANILLGINQALTWSMTVNMKIDIVTENQRGLAIGLNEFAGYLGVALAAAGSGYVASAYSLRPEPFYLGIGAVALGFILSLFTKDTSAQRKAQAFKREETANGKSMSAKEVFAATTWKDKTLSSASFAGLTTNLKDGMAWGLLPLFFAATELSLWQIGFIIAIYPAAWGFFQLFTGFLSDRIGRKWLIVAGMWTQAAAIWWLLLSHSFGLWMWGAILLGLGTAMVYPTLQAAVSDVAHPGWRASALGVFRLWRDSGYAFGALLAGVLADWLNLSWAMGLVAVLPFAAGGVVALRMQETVRK